jgi:hypothetical protein
MSARPISISNQIKMIRKATLSVRKKMKRILMFFVLVGSSYAIADSTTVVVNEPNGSLKICKVVCDESGKICRVVCF